jgi:hypothetical protein
MRPTDADALMALGWITFLVAVVAVPVVVWSFGNPNIHTYTPTALRTYVCLDSGVLL